MKKRGCDIYLYKDGSSGQLLSIMVFGIVVEEALCWLTGVIIEVQHSRLKTRSDLRLQIVTTAHHSRPSHTNP